MRENLSLVQEDNYINNLSQKCIIPVYIFSVKIKHHFLGPDQPENEEKSSSYGTNPSNIAKGSIQSLFCPRLKKKPVVGLKLFLLSRVCRPV